MTGDQNPAPGPAPGVPIKVTPEILLQVLTTPPASGPAPFPAVPVDLPAPADIANGHFSPPVIPVCPATSSPAAWRT